MIFVHMNRVAIHSNFDIIGNNIKRDIDIQMFMCCYVLESAYMHPWYCLWITNEKIQIADFAWSLMNSTHTLT